MHLSIWITTKLLETIGQVLWGFKPNLMAHIAEQHGAIKSISWFAQNMPTYEKILKEWGPISTHLLATEISVLNSCPYCTYGHIYALELHYLKEKGNLMPRDEDDIVAWHALAEPDVIDNFRELINSADLGDEMPILDRMLLLRKGVQKPVSSQDYQILHLVQMFGFLNTCGVKGNTNPDQAHDPINKDMALQNEYKRLRSQNTVEN